MFENRSFLSSSDWNWNCLHEFNTQARLHWNIFIINKVNHLKLFADKTESHSLFSCVCACERDRHSLSRSIFLGRWIILLVIRIFSGIFVLFVCLFNFSPFFLFFIFFVFPFDLHSFRTYRLNWEKRISPFLAKRSTELLPNWIIIPIIRTKEPIFDRPNKPKTMKINGEEWRRTGCLHQIYQFVFNWTDSRKVW